jgi:membrane protease subunit (stomatin/prohibitin family)
LAQPLSGDEQVLYRQRSVFAGAWSLNAAGAKAGGLMNGHLGLDMLTRLGRLAEHSPMQQVKEPEGKSRFSMSEMIRECGFE